MIASGPRATGPWASRLPRVAVPAGNRSLSSGVGWASHVARRSAMGTRTWWPLAVLGMLAALRPPPRRSRLRRACCWPRRGRGDRLGNRPVGCAYVLPDEEDYVQPTFKADHGHLHSRPYTYQNRESMSFFVSGQSPVVEGEAGPHPDGRRLVGRRTGSCRASRRTRHHRPLRPTPRRIRCSTSTTARRRTSTCGRGSACG